MVLALTALLALSSCTLAFEVRASFVNGALTFVVEESDELVSPWCSYDFEVLDDQGVPIWKFEAQSDHLRPQDCNFFPLRYGDAPARATITSPAQPLGLGRLYVIKGHATGILEGAFLLYRAADRLVLRNVDPDSEHVQRIEKLDYANRRTAVPSPMVPAS